MRARQLQRTALIAGVPHIAGHKGKSVFADSKEDILAGVIVRMVDPGAKVVLDMFGGTNLVGAGIVESGRDLITNDFRKQPYYCALAMLANRSVNPTEEDVLRLTSGELNPGPVTRRYGEPLGHHNALEFDRVIRNACTLRAEGLDHVAVAAIYGITHVIMAALKVYHLHLSRDRRLFLGNEHIRLIDLAAAWRKWILYDYPLRLPAGDTRVECYSADAVALIGGIRADSGIFDSEYPCNGYHYVADFKPLDDICEVFEGVEEHLIGKVRPSPKHQFGSRQAYFGSITHLLLRAAHIPQWIICINTSSNVSPEEVALIVKAMGRTCAIHRYPVDLPTTIPGAKVTGNCECLLDCRADERAAAEVAAIKDKLAQMAGGRDWRARA